MRQNGVAIVLAMSVVALASIVATTILVGQSTWARQSELESEYRQAQALVDAEIDWASAVLRDDRHMSSIDHLDEPWSMKVPPMEVSNGTISGSIEDQHGKFNLNNLIKDGKINATQLASFRRLLAIIHLPDNLADRLAGWIDTDHDLPQNGDDGDYHRGPKAPHSATLRPLLNMNELALITGFDRATRARLSSFVCTLPQSTKVNINTASAEVLAGIVDGLDIDVARLLVAERKTAYFRDQADFLARLPKGATVPVEAITVNSAYFVASVHAQIGEARATGIALLDRTGSAWPQTVWRKKQ